MTSEILQDVSAPALVHAIEANAFEFFSLFRHWAQAETYNEPDLLWSITSVPFPLFNSVLRAQLAPESVDATIETAIARCASKNVPMLWWTGPATRPKDLGAHLESHGFVNGGEAPGMAVDLQQLNESLLAPSGLTIKQVDDSEAQRKWCDVFTVGFGMPDFVTDHFSDLLSSLGLDSQQVRHYIGWLDGKPVGTSSLLLGAGVAGIYNVATIPEARKKNIGAAMTLTPLLDARAMGYRVGILQSSEMGFNVYRKLGFQEYCKIGHYIWASATGT